MTTTVNLDLDPGILEEQIEFMGNLIFESQITNPKGIIALLSIRQLLKTIQTQVKAQAPRYNFRCGQCGCGWSKTYHGAGTPPARQCFGCDEMVEGELI